MNHLKWMGHTATVMEIQKGLHQDTSSCDVTLSCKGKTVRVHRFLLCACSDYFREIFQGLPDREDVTIICPDIRENIIESILNFIYFGEVSVNSSNLSDFLESINLLGIKSAISFECHINKTKISKGYAAIEDLKSAEVNKNETQNSPDDETTTNCGTKDFEYLEVYNGDDKMDQYEIEQIDTSCNETNSDYIITENVENSFTISEVKQDQNIADNKHTQTSEYVETVLPENSIIHEKEYNLTETTTTTTSSTSSSSSTKLATSNKKLNKITKTTTTTAETAAATCCSTNTSGSGLNQTIQTRDDAFENAVNAVIHLGMSLQKAATKFNVTKTVLWRRVKKNSAYKAEREHPMLRSAIEKLENGESLKSISQALNIPISTLHRQKVKLLQEGRLPEHMQIKRRDSKDHLRLRLSKAIDECRRGMSQNQAATIYGVPKSTLWRHVQKKNMKLIKAETIEEISLSD